MAFHHSLTGILSRTTITPMGMTRWAGRQQRMQLSMSNWMAVTPMARPASAVLMRAYTQDSTTSSKSPSVTVSKHATVPEIAVVTLHQSAFDQDTARLLIKEWKAMEQDQTIRAAMLTSDQKAIFCAGIDFKEFLKGPESFGNYWRTIRHVFDVIYSSRLNTAASMHGHSLGLGCVLGLACQDRFMMGQVPKPGTIGLNEVAVGVPVPHWLVELFASVTSRRAAERFLPVGHILSVQEAVQVGLVDKADFSTRQELEDFVVKHLETRNKAPRTAQAETIRVLRLNFLKIFRDSEEEDVKTITRYVAEDEAQTILAAQVARLASKTKK